MAEYPALDLRVQPGHDAANLEPRIYAALDGFQPLAIQEHEADQGWLVFFRSPATRDAAAEAVSQLGLHSSIALTAVEIPDDDWARRSQANLTAITVGRITVAPPWDSVTSASDPLNPESPIPDPGYTDPVVIVIDPSMGFGTGHHQTTRLCLALLQSVDVAGRRVIDVGTGSGVLAIAARRLGAVTVVAIDNDPDAIENARENVERNGVRDAVDVRCEALSAFAGEPADIVTANLTAAMLLQDAPSLRRLVAPSGVLIVSGFSPEELPGVVAAFGHREVRQAVEDEWAAAMLRI